METTVSSAGAASFAATAGTSVSFVGAADAHAESSNPAITSIAIIMERFFFIFFSFYRVGHQFLFKTGSVLVALLTAMMNVYFLMYLLSWIVEVNFRQCLFRYISIQFRK
jgi:hypothetical protein